MVGMKLDCRPSPMMLEGVCVNYTRAVQADLRLAVAGITVEPPILDGKGEVIAELSARVRPTPPSASYPTPAANQIFFGSALSCQAGTGAAPDRTFWHFPDGAN